ncbi:Glycosyl hydrolase family 10 protein [Dorcoceras hygrometricum]|uniref:Glycosyl hydrolase family 10 protein n=1 Tax=Dorcoceras hygrometricum TaxID=472368 RepID=A0A2Z6ZZY5_9LAMI|nr:Glycosyl hydrolase family 10 protein [Dorcoceras hygrometricum]
MEMPSTGNASNTFYSEPNLNEELKDPIATPATNIIQNHDFSGGFHLWHPNCCRAFVVSPESVKHEGSSTKFSGTFAVVTNRKEHWQGLEQDITSRVSTGSNYKVCAWVGVSGAVQGVADVLATLKLENQNSSVSYMFIGRYFLDGILLEEACS